MLEPAPRTDAPSLQHSLHQSYLPVLVAVLLGLGLLWALKLRDRKLPDRETQRSTRSYTAEEVGRHTREDDAWIILKGKVYDVTPYVNEHPGGAAILRNAGGDATEGFFGPQHPDRVFDLIDDFYVGDLVKP